MREALYAYTAALGRQLGFENLAIAGNLLGRTLWTAAPSRARLATDAVAFHLEKTPEEAARIAKASFSHNCRSFLESMLTSSVDWRFVRDRLHIVNPEILREAARAQGPTVLTTAHMGAWELLTGIFHLFFHHPYKHVVVRTLPDAALNALTIRQRTRPSVSIIEHRQAAAKVLRSLKRGGATAFLVDHNCRHDEAVFLPFLRKTAAVNVGPALLAVRSGAGVWPAFMRRTEEGGYVLQFDEPLMTADIPGDWRDKLDVTALFYTQAVERWVRAWPEQWFWMHKRWKTRPNGEA
ncbi:MAG: lysophospholipid acyltransferase family protein [Desulfovibrionaceae bacterium]